jgi:phosphotransferase system HPr (HPr) family protein
MSANPMSARPDGAGPAGAEAAVTAGRAHPSQESQDAMNGDSLHHKLVIANPDGLHMRPATAFAEVAKQCQSQVRVHKDGKAYDGKSPLDMMLLAAAQGTELDLEVAGPDAPDALRRLLDLLVSLSVIDNTDPPLPPKG